MTPQLLIGRLMTEQEWAPWVTPQDVAEAAAFASPQRRAERLTWRAMLRRATGLQAAVVYDAVGAPSIPNAGVQISVSHCRDAVALCLSERPCAVDMERADRNFSRAAARYLSAKEAALCSDDSWPGVVWCAKEVMYKISGCCELDFRDDLQVLSVEGLSGASQPACEPVAAEIVPTATVTGQIKNREPLRLSVHVDNDHLLVWRL